MRHINFLLGAQNFKWGVLGGGPKVYVEKGYMFFPPPLDFDGHPVMPVMTSQCCHFLQNILSKPKPKVVGPDIFRRVGIFHVKGWGPKSSVYPSKPRKTKRFVGCPGIFGGMSRGRPKSLRKKSLCSIFAPYLCRRLVQQSRNNSKGHKAIRMMSKNGW